MTTPITGAEIWKNIRLYESNCYIRLYILIIFYAWLVTTPITGTGILSLRLFNQMFDIYYKNIVGILLEYDILIEWPMKTPITGTGI